MCELFGMSSLRSATIQVSFKEFSRHVGLTGAHKDGWGIAFYEGSDVRLMREAGAASDSALARFVQEHPPASGLVVSHIRKATQGSNNLANCQPFARELGGRMHVFAHNGHLDRETLALQFPRGVYRPVGDGDSEYAVCALLDR
ncbi:MAG: class II glutamine amidotransferase, partial [Burkholderiales bacterium]